MFVSVRSPSVSRHLTRTVVEANIKIGYIFTILGHGAIGNEGRGGKGGPCTFRKYPLFTFQKALYKKSQIKQSCSSQYFSFSCASYFGVFQFTYIHSYYKNLMCIFILLRVCTYSHQ